MSSIEWISPTALQQLSPSIGGGPVLQVDLSPLVGAIERLCAVQQELLNLAANPQHTVADEHLRMGMTALANNWYDDAEHEFSISIDDFPYRAEPWFRRGLTRCRRSNLVGAIEDFRQAVKYASAEDPEAGLTAALLIADLSDLVAAPRESYWDVLAKAVQLGPSTQIHRARLVRLPSEEDQRKWITWLMELRGAIVDIPEDTLGVYAEECRAAATGRLSELIDAATELSSRALSLASYIERQPPLPNSLPQVGVMSSDWQTGLHHALAWRRSAQPDLFPGDLSELGSRLLAFCNDPNTDPISLSLRSQVNIGTRMATDLHKLVGLLHRAFASLDCVIDEVNKGHLETESSAARYRKSLKTWGLAKQLRA